MDDRLVELAGLLKERDDIDRHVAASLGGPPGRPSTTMRRTHCPDVICALGGDDHIDAGNGNDVIYGGSGTDYIDGGNGDNTIYAGDAGSILIGGNGDDTVDGGNGNAICQSTEHPNSCTRPSSPVWTRSWQATRRREEPSRHQSINTAVTTNRQSARRFGGYLCP